MAGVIVASLRPKSPQEAESPLAPQEPEVDENAEGRKAAAEDILSAIEARDAEGLANALQSFMDLADHDELDESESVDEVPQE